MTDEPSFDISQFGGEVHRVMVVTAHPDDLETTCGGTLALLIRSGVDKRQQVRSWRSHETVGYLIACV